MNEWFTTLLKNKGYWIWKRINTGLDITESLGPGPQGGGGGGAAASGASGGGGRPGNTLRLGRPELQGVLGAAETWNGQISRWSSKFETGWWFSHRRSKWPSTCGCGQFRFGCYPSICTFQKCTSKYSPRKPRASEVLRGKASNRTGCTCCCPTAVLHWHVLSDLLTPSFPPVETNCGHLFAVPALWHTGVRFVAWGHQLSNLSTNGDFTTSIWWKWPVSGCCLIASRISVIITGDSQGSPDLLWKGSWTSPLYWGMHSERCFQSGGLFWMFRIRIILCLMGAFSILYHL